MNKLKIFENKEFGRIRTIEINEQPYFVGRDVAEALGYKNTKDALITHVDESDKRIIQRSEIATIENHIPNDVFPVNFVSADIPNRGLTIINESGLYALIFGSKLESAKEFKHWVTSEVLPSIRKTGSYSMTENQKMMAETRMHNIRIRKAAILNKIAEDYSGTYRQVLQSYATKELTGEFLLPLPEAGEKTLSATELGKILGISANMVGKIANTHNLKTPQNGKFFHDKSKHSSKEVETFRYFESAVDVFKQFL